MQLIYIAALGQIRANFYIHKVSDVIKLAHTESI